MSIDITETNSTNQYRWTSIYQQPKVFSKEQLSQLTIFCRIANGDVNIEQILQSAQPDKSLDQEKSKKKFKNARANRPNEISECLETLNKNLIANNYLNIQRKLTKELDGIYARLSLLKHAITKIPVQWNFSEVEQKLNPQEQAIHNLKNKISAQKKYLKTRITLEEKRHIIFLEYKAKIAEQLNTEPIKSWRYVDLIELDIDSIQRKYIEVGKEIAEAAKSHIASTEEEVPSLGKRIVRKICAPVSWVWKEINRGFLLNWKEWWISHSIEKHQQKKYTMTSNYNSVISEALDAKINKLQLDLILLQLQRRDLEDGVCCITPVGQAA
jgi:hypothetical protein